MSKAKSAAETVRYGKLGKPVVDRVEKMAVPTTVDVNAERELRKTLGLKYSHLTKRPYGNDFDLDSTSPFDVDVDWTLNPEEIKSLASRRLAFPQFDETPIFDDEYLLPEFESRIINKDVPDEVKDVFYNTVLPRLEARRPGYTGGIHYPTVKSKVDATVNKGYTEYPEELFAISDDANAGGIYFPLFNHVAVREGQNSLGHELRHRLDKILDLTDVERDILSRAYDDDFINLAKYVPKYEGMPLQKEMVTTNFDARNKLLSWSKKKLNTLE